ncbi:MAG: class I tRNA ligase family protein, partial [Sedimentisphaerales bacterium]|nr:class I tRNA ligase family protein [Sedimentisphaerales bacterium]
DVGNPWLDAGIVPYSTMKYNSDRAYWEQWFPADLVLECFPGQFRNWFYALLAMSTMMEGKAPFKTLLGHALVRDEHGKEMHKSTGNAIWFDDAAEKMGADVMRWMYCSQNPTNNLNFGYTPGDQVRRRVFGTWWNVYSFFVNYARLDGFDASRELVAYDKLQDIDRWLLSKLQELIKVANQSLTDFNVAGLVTEAERFIERLSNWYIRRNRRRYWRPKSDSDTDKLAAYQTLYRVLVDLCKILAPICPFVTEDMYQNLVRSVNPTAPESVHHTDYPQVDAKLYDEKIAQDMDMIADVVSRVLSIRENKKIRVRQPLATVTAVAGPARQEVLKRFESHILDELNIKELAFTTELGDYVTYTIKPNFKTLGTKVGKEMGKVRTLIAEANASELAAKAHAGENFKLGDFDLAAEDILVEMQFDATLAVNDAGDPPVILNIEITPELLREGIARDMVRHIQQARKDNGLEIQNHITMQWYCTDETIKKAIAEHGSYISHETLCDNMTETATSPANAIELELETGKLYFVIAMK